MAVTAPADPATPTVSLAEAAAVAQRAVEAERAAAGERAQAERPPAGRRTAARRAAARLTPSGRRSAAAAPADESTPAPAAPTSAVEPASAQPAPVTGVGPWVRCFAEELRPAGPDAIRPGDDRPWRVRAATGGAFGALVSEVFPDDPAAGRALAIVGDPADPDSCAVALAAARDAIGSGRLVLVTHGPGFTGFCASLHAEHPELGITVLRVPQSAEGLRAARRFAAAEPGTFRELVIDTAGHPHETVMMPAETAGHR